MPHGWSRATVGDFISLIQYGSSSKTNDDHKGIPVLRMGNIQNATLIFKDLKYLPVNHDEFPKLLLVDGDILFNRTNSPELVGKTAVYHGTPSPCSFASYLIRLRLSGFEPLLLSNFINSPLGKDWIRSVVNQQVGQANINGTKLKALELPVPPLNEQHRIVTKIEALQERSRAAKEALDAIPSLLEKFRQSVLAAAFRGDLTRNWRAAHPDVEPASVLLERIRAERKARFIEDQAEKARTKAETKARAAGMAWTDTDSADVLAKERVKAEKKYKAPVEPDLSQGIPELPDTWAITSVAEITECLDSVRKPITREDRTPGPYPYYGANGQVDSVADYLFDEPLVLVTEDETFYGRTKPIAYCVDGKCWVNNHAHVLRPLHPIPRDYVWQSLMHYNVIPWLSGTTGRAKLTQGALNQLPLAIAPAEEMKVIAQKVAETLSFSDSIESINAEMNEPLKQLNQSILSKAFRGELVPQDPNDEPAEVLLDRIRAERAAVESSKSKRKTKSRTAKRKPSV